ncbi:MAG: DUF2851 family protein [Chloroflexi bacterium]|nr:DUF2851 family protein [Chloroflexota bacterium]
MPWVCTAPNLAVVDRVGDAYRKVSASVSPPISVVVRFPGWASKAPGPDFRDSILVGPTAELRGDVEIHRDARDWYRHGTP